MIDTHAHINKTFYQDDLGGIVKFALEKDVKKIVCAGTSLSDSKLNLEMAQQYPGVIYPAVGIHPHNEGEESGLSIDEQVKSLDELIAENREQIVAVGECGLDFSVASGERHRDAESSKEKPLGIFKASPLDANFDEQRKVFLAQIDLAVKYKLPLLLHINKAYDEVLEILKAQNTNFTNGTNKEANLTKHKLRGVFHCYTGGKKRIAKIIDLGFYFGIGGLVTYDEGIMGVVKEIPLEKILLETDCPFLAPVPHRGERNQPGYLPLIAAKIAEIKGVTAEEVEKVTTENAEGLLKI